MTKARFPSLPLLFFSVLQHDMCCLTAVPCRPNSVKFFQSYIGVEFLCYRLSVSPTHLVCPLPLASISVRPPSFHVMHAYVHLFLSVLPLLCAPNFGIVGHAMCFFCLVSSACFSFSLYLRVSIHYFSASLSSFPLSSVCVSCVSPSSPIPHSHWRNPQGYSPFRTRSRQHFARPKSACHMPALF